MNKPVCNFKMMQLSATQRTLLELLGDGSCHSGSQMGHTLGMTRSGVWKQINQLIEFGIPILRIPHHGYQLQNPLILLNEEEVTSQLKANGFNHPFDLHFFTSIDSTNRYLKDLPLEREIAICCAEQQTQGRGRFSRSWYSPFGENIYCSTRWSLQRDLSKLSGLSLVTSLAVLSTIKEFAPSQDIKVKWPNDILWQDKKLCGTLIEIMAESNGNAQVIIGIGLNVNSDTQNKAHSDLSWCSLSSITDRLFNRNLIIARLILNLSRYINKFLCSDLGAFIDEWAHHDYLKNKPVTVTQYNQSISGTAQGISTLGELIVLDDNNKVHYLSSGDASLKPL